MCCTDTSVKCIEVQNCSQTLGFKSDIVRVPYWWTFTTWFCSYWLGSNWPPQQLRRSNLYLSSPTRRKKITSFNMSKSYLSLNTVQSLAYIIAACLPNKQHHHTVGLPDKQINVCLLWVSHWWGMQAVKGGWCWYFVCIYVSVCGYKCSMWLAVYAPCVHVFTTAKQNLDRTCVSTWGPLYVNSVWKPI